MAWKARKEKLRAERNGDPQTSDGLAPDTEPAASTREQQTPPEAVGLNPLPFEAGDAPAFDAPLGFSAQEASPEAEGLHLDKPEAFAPSFGAETGNGDNPALDPFNFAPSSDLDNAPTFAQDDLGDSPISGVNDLGDTPTFGVNNLEAGPTFGINDLDAAVAGLDDGEDDAPVFGLDSVFDPETGEDAPAFAPLPSAFDPLPDEAADAFALPLSGPEPIALGGDPGPQPIALGADTDFDPLIITADTNLEPLALGGETGGAFGAFAPYQPPTEEPGGDVLAAGATDDDAYSDPNLEIGAMPFDPQSPSFGMFDPEAPTAGEEIAQETIAPAFADARDTSPLAFEPAFEAPDALAGEAAPNGEDMGDEPFMDRDALAAGLVTMEPSTGLPRVAPFVLPGLDSPAFGDNAHGPHALILRLGGLSATYPLVKPVTTIGRPDGETATYPDIEVDLDDGVSRRHAEVRQEGESVFLVDVGSTNGTILNGEMLAANQPARLMRGDRIRIGERVEIVFE